ncbi:MAG: CHRD domain-containing protein [Gemmatimonadaceae bacterium]|nr:CHRD domain-containing protein [Gemmatimonadaceae bacterium]NUQ94087.1 CHRD domain-containing protein [Gemmatimonadaceae bacterium]NUR21116.1 CHRD domain-containing protein [Gemmatimonadaceae bacterium]NUS98386.1 CHRD domain-containing protein [Gemmatimonadaceae bacterium]
MHRISPLTLAGAVLCAAAVTACNSRDTAAPPKPEQYTASLSGSNETTPPALIIGATGSATITVNGHDLAWTLTTANFASGTTAPGSSSTTLPAHIHVGAAGVSGGIVVPLSATVNGTTSGTATVVDSVLTHLRAGDAYVNVHTAARPSGEIRGQLTRVQ